MNITRNQKRIIQDVLNVFETGTPAGNYSDVSIYPDGPQRDGSRVSQVTYGRSQTTEFGNLRLLITNYVATPRAAYAESLRPYISRIGNMATRLAGNSDFIKLLKQAGRDPVMHEVQDAFFDTVYYLPAVKWCDDNGFTKALSLLVIYDSFIHSGQVLQFLRNRFPERPPAAGGEESVWIDQYVDTRHNWLRTHTNTALRKTIYRTSCLKREIAGRNWDLTILPIDANGVDVS